MRNNNFSKGFVPFVSLITRSGLVLILLFVCAGVSGAYTLVFRDGHKVVVPPIFELTATTMTFEAAPGINRTVQLVLIDIAATELANSEAPGGFSRHAQPNQLPQTPAAFHRAIRTLTNLDLEASRQRRLDSEQSYEQRRIELGLPSIEETRRRQAQEEAATTELIRQRAAAEANDEAYWRSRARTLRNEILTVDAEINYLRSRAGSSRQTPFVTQGFVAGAVPFTLFGGRPAIMPQGAGRMGAQGVSAGSAGLTNLGAVALRPHRPLRTAAQALAFPASPYFYSGNYYEANDLNPRLNDLLTRRAGLEALWRELEQESRLARVPQIWLAP